MQFDNQSVGIVIREHRLRRGMSQELLSGLAGIARSHLSMIETGAKAPNLETVWRIALALELRPSALIADIEKETESRRN